MDKDYQRVLYKLNTEHSLDLVDPDDLLNTLETTHHYRLHRELKDLWTEDREKWHRISRQFGEEIHLLESNWVYKPNGDPNVYSQGTRSKGDVMVEVLKRLIDEEKSRFIPQSTMAFSASQQEMLQAFADDDYSQGSSQTYTRPEVVHDRWPTSSISTMTAPSSSFLEALGQVEPDAHAFQAVQAYAKDDAIDAMVIDDQTRMFAAEDNLPNAEPCSRKRSASLIMLEDQLPKRKSDIRYPHQMLPVGNYMDFSFNNGRENPQSGNTSRSFSRTTSVNTSFRSVALEGKESFDTQQSTPPPIRAERSIGGPVTCKEQAITLDRTQRYTQDLILDSPFAPHAKANFDRISYRVAYEIFRVSLHNGYDASEVLQHAKKRSYLSNDSKDFNDLSELWKALKEYVHQHDGTMPIKTSDNVWKSLLLPRRELQHSSLSFTGTISFGTTANGSLLKLKLNPISFEKSNRLKRKFGSDRLIVLGFPSLEAGDVPSRHKSNAVELRRAIIDWLTNTQHHLLGRQWRAFYVRGKSSSKASEKKTQAWAVYLFAIDEATNLDSMLKWFFAFEDNSKEYVLKLFSRLQLAISDTTPTVMFKIGDSRVDQLEVDPTIVGTVFEVDDITIQNDSGNSIVMTDGCGRISLKAAELIHKKLALLPPMPCAFQARIAGAKGMWIVEPNQNIHKDIDLWIEIRHSQKKFDTLSRDRIYVDSDRITFEVNEYSRPLKSAALNFQLLQILIDRGVPKEVFIDLLREDLDSKVADLGSAISDGPSLRAWIEQECSVAESRINANGIIWEGGMPSKDAEQIIALTEAGFTPISCLYLQNLCKGSVHSYCTRVEEQVKIRPGKTTFALMIPDPYGILEEDQIHVGFSTAFIESRLQWWDTILHEIDVLVARLPAALPSDIHKVRAVFRPELAHLKDVVVFPTKGSFCLADKLSGGDYDGDRAWLCWNEAIVKDFRNFDAPEKKGHSHYGIEKDYMRIHDILERDIDTGTQATQFVKAGFEFNMRKSMLGRCTNIHEAFCYKLFLDSAKMGEITSPMSDSRAMDLGNLLGYLVDTAKNGYEFPPDACTAYLKSILAHNLADPAYKMKNGAIPTNHIIDEIVLIEARGFRQKALGKLDQIFRERIMQEPIGKDLLKDIDLIKLFRDEKEAAKGDPIVAFVLNKLAEDMDDLYTKWERLVGQGLHKHISWTEAFNSIREHFLNITPILKDEQGLQLTTHPLIQRWHTSTKLDSPPLSTHHSWSLLKASACYNRIWKGPFPWRACGKELMALKVLVNQNGVSMSSDMHQYFKLDRRRWETAKLRRSERDEMMTGGAVAEFDEDEFMSQAPEEAYEWQANAE